MGIMIADGVAKKGVPFANAEIGRYKHRALFVTARDNWKNNARAQRAARPVGPRPRAWVWEVLSWSSSRPSACMRLDELRHERRRWREERGVARQDGFGPSAMADGFPDASGPRAAHSRY